LKNGTCPGGENITHYQRRCLTETLTGNALIDRRSEC
jgi:hypothetical protein